MDYWILSLFHTFNKKCCFLSPEWKVVWFLTTGCGESIWRHPSPDGVSDKKRYYIFMKVSGRKRPAARLLNEVFYILVSLEHENSHCLRRGVYLRCCAVSIDQRSLGELHVSCPVFLLLWSKWGWGWRSICRPVDDDRDKISATMLINKPQSFLKPNHLPKHVPKIFLS